METSKLAHSVREFVNAELGEASSHTNRLSNGVTSFVYRRQWKKDMVEFEQKLIAKFGDRVSMKITKPSNHPKGTSGWTRIYVSK